MRAYFPSSAAKIIPLVTVSVMCMIGCGESSSNPALAEHSHDHAAHAHHHEPPHGGTVIRLGDESFHMEWVKDLEAGIMRCFIMDGHLEKFIRITQVSFDVSVHPADGPRLQWTFHAAENRATGEQVGDTSEFHAQLSALPNKNTFEGNILAVHISGQQFENVAFKYPEGNETH